MDFIREPNTLRELLRPPTWREKVTGFFILTLALGWCAFVTVAVAVAGLALPVAIAMAILKVAGVI